MMNAQAHLLAQNFQTNACKLHTRALALLVLAVVARDSAMGSLGLHDLAVGGGQH
jgi:hypothetical protein